jgi:multimeric flavodoxin WrbA
MMGRKVLGIAGSLRNARGGRGNRALISELEAIGSKEELTAYLARQSQVIVEQFLAAGIGEGKSFDEVYRKLREAGGDAGLSNTEAALAAALWAAHREGAEIDHLSLGEYFTVDGRVRNSEELRWKLIDADGLLISGPVYFGDRGSLAESLIAFISNDDELREALRGRLYGGITVGAKRNGGQETALIYQMLDMVNLGLLTVGNDSETTAQYGGTGHAGDVGTMWKDAYGLETSMGTGRRIARTLRYFASTERSIAPRTLFLLLGDHGSIGASFVTRLAERFGSGLLPTVLDVTGRPLHRCIACDICPTHVGMDEDYRCVITAKSDSMSSLHPHLLHHDLIIPVVTSLPGVAGGSSYQTFLERTRYLRHCDFIWTDVLIAPLVLEEPGDFRTLPIRMMTSFIRHHTVMAKPMVAYLQDGRVTNAASVEDDFSRTLEAAARLTAGRLTLAKGAAATTRYNPIGYVLSAEKEREDQLRDTRRTPAQARHDRLVADAEARLAAHTAASPTPRVADEDTGPRPLRFRLVDDGRPLASAERPRNRQ